MDVAWIYLIAASLLEPVWVICLEKSDNFKNLKWSFWFIVSIFLCLWLLALAVEDIGPGISYTVLAGIGSVLTVAAGITLYKETASFKRIIFIVMIIIGIIVVRLSTGGVL
ncbi:MAG: SMR family transporter [Methanomassiliicoccaceae archaeon]|nr:quaternary ammonium compound-resistance protein SugE [Candidatus Methanomethylophilaceae archaeon]MEA4978005.1 SMR family transporter [Methanomassiliicoccaceae archaeon]